MDMQLATALIILALVLGVSIGATAALMYLIKKFADDI